MLTILDEINKALGYLNINTKYINKMYTLLAPIPIFFVIKSILDMKASLLPAISGYVIGLILLLYFWVLNFMYYFLNKNKNLDITQLLAKKLPDEMFNNDMDSNNVNSTVKLSPDTTLLNIEYVSDYSLILRKNIDYLIENKKLIVRDYKKDDGFLVAKNTLYPYYFVSRSSDPGYYDVKIGKDLNSLETIGKVYSGREKITTLGLFITGGPFKSNGIIYNKSYGLQLIAKNKKDSEKRAK